MTPGSVFVEGQIDLGVRHRQQTARDANGFNQSAHTFGAEVVVVGASGSAHNASRAIGCDDGGAQSLHDP